MISEENKKVMQDAHREWVDSAAYSLSRKPTEIELKSLGRAPWEAAWIAATEHAIEVFLDHGYDEALALLQK